MSEKSSLQNVSLDMVSKRFGHQTVLKKISLAFESGTVTGIAGPNGAGKTTLLSLLSTLMSPSSGNLLYGDLGRSDGPDVERIRSQIGYLGHQSALYRSMTGEENLRFFARLSGKTGEDVARSVNRALEAVGMGEDRGRRIGECSRGMVQRFAFARLLVEDSVVWLLDEPTTGLDESSRDAVIRLIQRKAEEGGIIVVVSHDPAFLSAVSHRVVTLKAGRISVDGAGEVS